MSESYHDDTSTTERILLWSDISDTFQACADLAGMQISLDDPEKEHRTPTRLVLESKPDDEYTIQLWVEIGRTRMIGSATMWFINHSGIKSFGYDITPDDIVQTAQDPTPLDAEDIADLGCEIRQAEWSQKASEDCAQNILFFS